MIVLGLLPYKAPLYFLDSLNMRFEGAAPLGAAYDLVLDAGRNLSFLSFSGSIAVYDVSDPNSPALLSTVRPIPGLFVEMAYDPVSRTLWAADFYGEIHTYDVSDPSNPTEIGTLPLPFPITGLYLNGSDLYVAVTLGGVVIYDVSDPHAPAMVGSFSTPPYALDVYVDGGRAYVASDTGGIYIYDVSDPSSPAMLGSYAGGWRALAVLPYGNYLFVGADSTGLVVLDISDPSSPAEVAVYPTDGRAGRMVLSGSYLFLSDGPGGTLILDVSDPTSPRGVSYIPSPSYVLNSVPSGSYLFRNASINGLEIYEITSYEGMRELATYTYDNNVITLSLNGSYLYASVLYRGISTLDVSDPSSPVEVSLIGDSTRALTLLTSGSRLYALKYRVDSPNYYITAYSLSDPSSPSPLDSSFLPFSYPRLDMAAGDTLYIRDRGIVYLYDFTDPSSPVLISSFTTPDSSAGRLLKSGNTLFSYNPFRRRLYSYDISDPTSPVLLDSLSVPFLYFLPDDATLYNGHIYLPAIYSYNVLILVVDATDPSSMSLDTAVYVGPSPYSSLMISARAVGGKLLVRYAHNLCALSLSGPIPVRQECDRSPYYDHRLTTDGSYAYLPDDNVIDIWDVSSPSEPTFLSRRNDLTFSSSGVMASYGGRIYTADGARVFNVFDVSDPTSPSLRNRYLLPDTLRHSGGANDLVADGGYIYASSPFLAVFSLTDPDTPNMVAFLDTVVSVPIDTADTIHYRVRPLRLAKVGDHILGFYSYLVLSYDVSSPTSPTLSAAIYDSDAVYGFQGMAVSGDRAYFKTVRRIHIYNISDPSSPVKEGVVEPDTSFLYHPLIAVSGDTAFVYADRDGITYLLSLLLPSGTIFDSLAIGSYPKVRGLNGLLVGNLLYAADCEAVRAFDVSDPTDLRVVAYRKTPDCVVDVSVSGPYVFASIANVGLHAYRVLSVGVRERGRTATAVLSGKGGLTLRLTEEARVKVYDITGRLRYAARLGAGKYRVPLPAGVYMVVIRGEYREVLKAVVR